MQLYLDNQKNGQQGSTIYHDAITHTLFPIKSNINHIHYLYYFAPEDASIPIIYVRNIQNVTTANITLAVWERVVLSGLLNYDYSLLRVIPHPFRSSGTR